ncbi:MAG TPA: bifunctional adenosylcobinamide kinase/adenosylcobinamide-phosphate guanylyltransferase [Solirubrobacteraceae bacterium]|nr:bifunctional adenosylcobinamide kinase/adenosylcobinamide-phosphate guanylyltransferase [Solirubrobacteraceae bacterium]
MSLTLVLGGTRSGKSALAERLARESAMSVRYVATADPDDEAFAARIAAHVLRRPPEWETVVAGDALASAVAPERCVLIDGLGTWIAGVMHRAGAGDPGAAADWAQAAQARVRDEVAALARLAAASAAPLIVVAEQAGEGLLPADALSRTWLDALGDATVALADAAARVLLVVAGRALELPPALPVAADDAGLRDHGDALVRPGDTDHAVNVLSGGPPGWLRAALRRALEEDVAAYPREAEAVAALAALHRRDPAEIVPCNGAAHALWLLPGALRPRLAACVHPGFTESEAALRAHGVPVARVLRDPERGFALDPAAVPEAADLVVVGNPASPSGTLDPAAALLALRRPGRTVVVDEAFMDLVPGEPASLVREPLPDVVVTRSLTKSLGIPGVRAGYAVAPAPLAERLRAVRPPWSCNALALAALRAMAQRPEALDEAAARAQAERADLEARLADVPGLRTWPAAANYVLVRVPDGAAVAGRLRDAGIAVRPAGSFPGLTRDDLRITARGPRENERLAGALAEAIAR